MILEITKRGLPFNLVFTGQHKETMEQLLADFGIHIPHCYLYQGKEITGIAQMGAWFTRCLWKCLREADKFVPGSGNMDSIILVHGDTFSTLLGAVIGKLRGITVAHIEAGLRSGNIFHPFPEELTRRAVFR
ncbi:MAG: UDP-N-acetylglucosamine 2-epimerase, partial [Burkholderiales bacterium]